VSSPRNVVKIEKERVSQVPVIPATAFNSGDMMKWDSVNSVATPIVAADAANATSAANFIGVSNDTNPITSIGGAPPDRRITIITRGMMLFTIDDNATYLPGDAVTFGSDPQKVKKTGASGGAIIGYVAPENGFSNDSTTNSPVTGIVAVQGTTQLLINIQPAFTKLSTL
jgi:hypothetical protein